MIIKRKTQIILALLISTIFLFQNCATIISRTSERRFPERKQGAIVITKKDGYQTAGELITVKPNSLLLLDTEGKDVSVSIEEIKVIRIVKKSKALLGAGIGVLICGGGGALLGSKIEDSGYVLYFGGIGALGGAIIGGIIIDLFRTDKKIQIEGMTESEIQEALDKLRKKARIRDYK